MSQETNIGKKKLIDEYGMQEKPIPIKQYKADYGQVFFCNNKIKGWYSIQAFKGKKILNISGGGKKTFVFQDSNDTENTLSALHDPQNDYVEFQGRTSLPIQEIILAIQGQDKILSINSGKTHNLILTAQGKLFAFGYGEFGSLGLGGSIFEQKPRIVKKLQNRRIVSVACGMHHSLALSQFGDVYSWGRGFEGQLGISQNIQSLSAPQLIPAFYKYQKGEVSKLVKNPIIQIASGSYHSIAIDSKNKLYCWGQARYGQTGTGKKIKEPLPVHVPINHNNIQKKIIMIAGGFGHTLCLSQQGSIFAWGLNAKGQLGLGDQAETSDPNQQIKTIRAKYQPQIILYDMSKNLLPKYKYVCCGYNRSFAIDIDGCVWAWGGGNLGFKDSVAQRAPRKIVQNVQDRKFSHIFANQDCITGFAAINLISFSPNIVPWSGKTNITFTGTGFQDTGNQIVSYKLENLKQNILQPIYFGGTNTYNVTCPNFIEYLSSGIKPRQTSATLSISMDGNNYVKYDQTLYLFPQTVCVDSIEPKSGSTSGGTLLKLKIDISQKLLEVIPHITVGFQPCNTQNPNSKSLKSWYCVEGIYQNGQIHCKTPKIEKFDNSNPLYNVDISLNGQQFTQKPNTFRFYQLSNLSVSPIQGLSEGGYGITVQGNGLFDSNKTKINLRAQVIHNNQKIQLGRSIEVLNWDKIGKKFTFNMPAITWMMGHNENSVELIKLLKSVAINIELTLSGLEWINVGSFRFVDPPPPPPQPQQQKKDSKKDSKKGAKK